MFLVWCGFSFCYEYSQVCFLLFYWSLIRIVSTSTYYTLFFVVVMKCKGNDGLPAHCQNWLTTIAWLTHSRCNFWMYAWIIFARSYILFICKHFSANYQKLSTHVKMKKGLWILIFMLLLLRFSFCCFDKI